MATKVAIINFKGGVGKSTIAFHLAAFLARNHRVLVVDVDHQSSLSIVMLGGTLWESLGNQRLTCNTIFESYCNRKVVMPGSEIICTNPLHRRNPRHNFYPTLDLVPAQMELDDTEIEMASTTTGSPMLSEWQKRTLLCEWIDAVGANDAYDFIIFDCPPATKLVSQNALAASDFFLIPVIPDVMSSRGVTHFRNLVTTKIDQKLQFLLSVSGVAATDVPKSFVPNTRMAGIVASMAKVAGNAASGLTNVHTEQLAVLRRQWGDDLLTSVVKHMTGVQEAIDVGYPAWNIVQDQNLERVTPMLETACREIASRIS